MNTANLQMEGLLMAMEAVLRTLRDKDILSQAEIESALGAAETCAQADKIRLEGVSHANVEAVLFPIRFLRTANAQDGGAECYSKVAQQVARGH